ncbi:MAG: DUF2334 domain-containing protein [Lachnospiraceae bacterium]|nr:DUF2334 domain-containing protein [Lachnospiraceae bacterium]
MKIAIRMDDISPQMDHVKWERAERILMERGIAPLLGVVPDNRDSNLNREDKPEEEVFWTFIRECQEKGYVLALHGCHHVYDTDQGGMFPLNTFSEFAGHSYEKQLERLSHGKEILEKHGIRTELFMAPAHSYDKNTLKALKRIGITKLTDGFGTRPYEYCGMTFYPIAHHLEKQWDKPGYTTLVLHTNTMEEKDFERLERIVSRREVISYSEYLQAEPQKAGVGHRLWEYWMATAKRVLVQIRSGRSR